MSYLEQEANQAIYDSLSSAEKKYLSDIYLKAVRRDPPPKLVNLGLVHKSNFHSGLGHMSYPVWTRTQLGNVVASFKIRKTRAKRRR